MKQGYLFSTGECNASFDTEDYFVSETNKTAYDYIKKWPSWPDKFLVICGESSSGKTHLAHIWQKASRAIFLHTPQSQRQKSGLDESNFDDILKHSSAFIIDNEYHLINEKKFLHFYNTAREQDRWVMISITTNPKNIKLPDLRSRLLSLPTFYLKNPDEDLLKILLGKQFLEKHLHISDVILEYTAKRIERSFSAVKEIVRLVEEEVKLRNCKITMSLIKEILA